MSTRPGDLWQPTSLREAVSGEALAHSRRRVADTDDLVRAWVAFDDEAEPTVHGPLAGVPFGVKDIIDVAGYRTGHGSPLHDSDPPAAEDATVVSAWRRTGALPVGKTVTAEFAFFTPGPTRNPANPDHTPGSSSSGSAAAVAAGQVPLAIGTQTGASTTRPASYCGVASLTLARDRLPMEGVLALGPSLDRHGIIAASVSDVAFAWSALSGGPDVALEEGAPPRLLVWPGEALGVVSDEMRVALATATRDLVATGAVVDGAGLEKTAAALMAAYRPISHFEVRTSRARELSIAERIGPRWVELRTASEATTEADYQKSLATVADLLGRVLRRLEDHDAIIGPAATGAAPRGLGSTGDPSMSLPWQTIGLPQVAVPGLRRDDGLPLGLQVIARDEFTALRVGSWMEKALGRARPPAAAPPSSSDIASSDVMQP